MRRNNRSRCQTTDCHIETAVEEKEQTKKASPWAALEQKVQESPEFKGKADAIEMIQEIRNKISKGEKVPNFMIEGLKSSLADTAMTEELNLALAEL